MTLEEIKDQEACNDGYYRWGDVEERIISGDINVKQINHLIKQMAERYAQSQTQELKEQNAELVEMYKECFEMFIPSDKWDEATEFLSTYGSGLAKDLCKKEKYK